MAHGISGRSDFPEKHALAQQAARTDASYYWYARAQVRVPRGARPPSRVPCPRGRTPRRGLPSPAQGLISAPVFGREEGAAVAPCDVTSTG